MSPKPRHRERKSTRETQPRTLAPKPRTGSDLAALRNKLRQRGGPSTAAFLQRYFKTGPGQYGQGDQFLGIRVPELRRLVSQFRGLPLISVTELLRSIWHEERLLALLLLVHQYLRSAESERSAIHKLYLDHTRFINNWDLVDASAQHIIGAQLYPGQIGTLQRLARSESIWERRIAIMATLYWIRRRQFGPTLRIARLLLADPHDLIHKAVGWMLREIGNRDQRAAGTFLRQHYRRMPRTMLRYAIERFPAQLRQQYLKGFV